MCLTSSVSAGTHNQLLHPRGTPAGSNNEALDVSVGDVVASRGAGVPIVTTANTPPHALQPTTSIPKPPTALKLQGVRRQHTWGWDHRRFTEHLIRLPPVQRWGPCALSPRRDVYRWYRDGLDLLEAC